MLQSEWIAVSKAGSRPYPIREPLKADIEGHLVGAINGLWSCRPYIHNVRTSIMQAQATCLAGRNEYFYAMRIEKSYGYAETSIVAQKGHV